MTKYSVTQAPVAQLLSDVKSDKIAIPELQRPFVWDSIKVRDLMDSLYKGYPVGYLITWQSVGAKLKGGQIAAHQQIPKDHLHKNGFPDRGDYNQVANFSLTETAINIRISNRPPSDYMVEVDTQIETGVLTLGEIKDSDDLVTNLIENAIPPFVHSVDAGSYKEFLVERRRLMAAYIRNYYQAL